MFTFALAFKDRAPTGMTKRLKDHAMVISVYELSPNTLLVNSLVSDPQALNESLDLLGEGKPHGVLLRLNGSYFGYYAPDLWAWLTRAREGALS